MGLTRSREGLPGGEPSHRTAVTRSAIVIVAVLLVSSALAPGIVAGEEPGFEATVGQSVVVPGQSSELPVTLQNDAEDPEDRVDPAHDVQATMRSADTPLTVNSGTRVLGTVRDGQPVGTAFAISVPQGIDPGTYHLPIDVTYEFDGDERETETVHVAVTVPDRPVFRVVETESDVPVGGEGPVSLTIENVGTEAASDATVQVTSTTQTISFDESPTAARYVGSWEPGERRTVALDADTAPSASTGTYPLTGRVAFDDTDGNRQHSAPLPVALNASDRHFDLDLVDSTLQVAGDGTATVSVTNAGPDAVDDVSLEIVRTGPYLHPSQATYPVGRLDKGATADARVPIAVSNATESGPREITTRVTYAGDAGDRVRGDTQTLVVPVASMQSFDVEVRENTLRVDREGDLRLAVTNIGDRPVHDPTLRISKSAPSIHPEQHEYAIDTLGPGQTATVTFEIDVADGATPTPRTMTLTMAYDDADGDRRMAQPQTVRMDIAPEKPVFDVTVVDGSVPAGESGSVSVRISNTGEEMLRGLDANAFTDAPYTVTDDSAFVASLGPGESTTVQFGVSIPGDAQVKDYPLSVDIQYQAPDGETRLTDPSDIPVGVTPARGPVDTLAAVYWSVAPERDLIVGGVVGLSVFGLVLGTVGVWRRRADDE